jgi:hypothetical protein
MGRIRMEISNCGAIAHLDTWTRPLTTAISADVTLASANNQGGTLRAAVSRDYQPAAALDGQPIPARAKIPGGCSAASGIPSAAMMLLAAD